MTITLFGIIFIPISFAIFLLKPNYLAPWAVLASIFQAASVLNVGGGFPIGISPYFFVASLIAFRFLVLCTTGRLSFEHQETVLRYLRPLWLLTLWAVFSAFVLPVLFSGVGVYTPRGGMDVSHTVPLHWTMSNAAQAGYMTLNAAFVIYAAWLSSNSEYVTSLLRAFCWSGVLVAAIGIYQLLSHATGLPYPSQFFNSNPVWAQLTNQSLGGMSRMSATFTEPSVAGAFFAMWSAYLLSLTTYASRVGGFYWALLWIGLTMLVLTTSSTGYLTVAALLLLFIWKQIVRALTNGTINRGFLLAFISVAAAIIASIMFVPNFTSLLTEVFGKASSGSGQNRFATVWPSLQLVRDTWGLGAGLGSNRPSGMLFYVVSNLGLPGIALFCYLVYVTYASVSRLSYTNNESLAIRPYVIASAWAFGMELLAMITSGADLSAPHIWISWALVLAACRQAALHAESVTIGVEREDYIWRQAIA
jgi:hypothetical protein